MKDYALLEKIEQYIDGTLPSEELSEFVLRLSVDDELRKEVDNYQTALDTVTEEGRKQLKSHLREIHQEVITNHQARKPTLYKTMRIAAVIAAVAVVGSFLLYQQFIKPQSAKDNLFEQYFSPYMNVTASRGVNEDKANFLHKTAMYFYSNKEFDKAVLNFEELFKSTKLKQPEDVFYYGISCLSVNKNINATEAFISLTKTNDHIYFEQSQWYLALAYLNNNDIEKSLSILRIIIKGKGSYSDKALDLLEKLD